MVIFAFIKINKFVQNNYGSDFLKAIKIVIKGLFCFLTAAAVLIFAGVFYLQATVSDNYKIKKGDTFKIESIVPITATYDGTAVADASKERSIGESFSVDLKAFGVIPISKVNLQVVDELYVTVLGNPFGMKIYTNGVMVTSLSDVKTKNGNLKPAKDAGIKLGDYILSVNGQEVTTNEELSEIVEKSNGQKLKFKVLRGNTIIYITFCAVKSTDTDSFKIGLWVKDSSAGIGTLTFYSPTSNVICGLGHGICEEETGEIINIKQGTFVTAEIISVEKGEVGKPGKLNGRMGYDTIGTIAINSKQGVYSHLAGEISFSGLTEIALKQEVKNGKAQIVCTVDGNLPKAYDCTVEVRSSAYHNKTQNLIVTVTDKTLLEKTGGIVQGMSGSPIIQNGKLVGAVTHVLIDDPTKGYGIFAENMLETARNVTELKEAG